MRDDRREHTLSGEAARQLARQVRYLERLPRNRQPHRRRSVNPAAAAVRIGKLTAALNAGSSATVQFYKGPPLSETSDGSDPQTCYPWMMASGSSVPSGTQVVCARINGYWYVIEAACTAF